MSEPTAEASYEIGTDGPGRILVGVDGSATSLHAGSYAFGMARRQSAKLVVLFVESTTSLAASSALTAGAAFETYDEIARELQEQMTAAAQRYDTTFEFVRRRGNPYVELIRVAEELRVDAVVVGASTQAGHRLVGSLAGRLVRDAKWPVTVVP